MDTDIMSIVYGIFAFYGLLIILILAGMWRIFTKAGQEGWKVLIPFYNLIVLSDIAKVDRKFAWYILAVYIIAIPLNVYVLPTIGELPLSLFQLLTNIVILICGFKILAGLSLNFGKSNGFTWGLLFLSFIFIPILGFGNAQYQSELVIDDDNILDANL